MSAHQILQEDFAAILSVIPVPNVEPLPQQFNGRLRTVLLLGRHVQVVDEDHAFLAHGRSEHTLATPVKLGHDDVLRLIG